MSGLGTPMSDPTDCITSTQFQRFFDYWDEKIKSMPSGKTKDKYFHRFFFIYALFMTGRRVSEFIGQYKQMDEYIPGLTLADIDPVNSKITFTILKKAKIFKRNKKGKKKTDAQIHKEQLSRRRPRVSIAYPKEFVQNLYDYAKKSLMDEDGNIEYDVRVFRYSRTTAYYIFRDMFNEAGVFRQGKKTVTAKTARHSFATGYLKSNVGNSLALINLKKVLQHSSTSITEHYLDGLDDIDILKTSEQYSDYLMGEKSDA